MPLAIRRRTCKIDDHKLPTPVRASRASHGNNAIRPDRWQGISAEACLLFLARRIAATGER